MSTRSRPKRSSSPRGATSTPTRRTRATGSARSWSRSTTPRPTTGTRRSGSRTGSRLRLFRRDPERHLVEGDGRAGEDVDPEVAPGLQPSLEGRFGQDERERLPGLAVSQHERLLPGLVNPRDRIVVDVDVPPPFVEVLELDLDRLPALLP